MCSVDGEEQGAPARCPAQPRQRPPGTGSGGNGSPRRPEGKQRRKPDAPACVTVDGSTTSGAPPPRGNANSLKRAEPGGRGSGRQGEAQATAHTVTVRPEPSCRGDDPGWMRRGGHRAHGAALLAHVTLPLFGQGPTLSAYRASVTRPVPCLRTVKSVRMTGDPQTEPRAPLPSGHAPPAPTITGAPSPAEPQTVLPSPHRTLGSRLVQRAQLGSAVEGQTVPRPQRRCDPDRTGTAAVLTL